VVFMMGAIEALSPVRRAIRLPAPLVGVLSLLGVVLIGWIAADAPDKVSHLEFVEFNFYTHG